MFLLELNEASVLGLIVGVMRVLYLRVAEVSGNVETWHGTLEEAKAKLAPSKSPHFRKLLQCASRLFWSYILVRGEGSPDMPFFCYRGGV